MTTQSVRSSDCPYEILEEKRVFKGKWINTDEVHFRAPKSKTDQVWECALKLKKPDAAVHGVHVVAQLINEGKKYIVLVKQYRIPINAVCIEFPGGYINANESVETAGMRELLEETGYTATRVLATSQGTQGLNVCLTDEAVRFVHVEIDGSRPENLNPMQMLDDCEQIEVLLIEMGQLFAFLSEQSEQKEIVISSEVYTFALAYQLTK